MASMSLTGGIQPLILKGCLGDENRENGLAARLLFTQPPRRAKVWTDSDIDPALEAAVFAVIDRLFSLEPDKDAEGEPQPRILRLSPGAKTLWIEFYNAHNEEQLELDGDVGAAWSKLEGYAARLALVVHLARWACGDPSLIKPNTIDEVSINAGITLSRWFGNEAIRIYHTLSEDAVGTERQRLVDLVLRKGGAITINDFQRSQARRYPTVEACEAALKDLEASGRGRLVVDTHAGGPGRPAQRFVLHGVDVDVNANAQANQSNSVNVNIETPPPYPGTAGKGGES